MLHQLDADDISHTANVYLAGRCKRLLHLPCERTCLRATCKSMRKTKGQINSRKTATTPQNIYSLKVFQCGIEKPLKLLCSKNFDHASEKKSYNF